MSSLLTIVLIGISLSMDAFSLALAYGVTILTKKQKILLSLIVGIYHFIMPMIGLILGTFIESYIFSHLNLIATIILIYIGIDLIISKFKEEQNIIVNNFNFLMFGLSVSIDSLIVGIGLKAITDNFLLASSIFSLISAIFTYLGLMFGTAIGNKVGSYSKIFGGLLLIIIAITLFVT